MGLYLMSHATIQPQNLVSVSCGVVAVATVGMYTSVCDMSHNALQKCCVYRACVHPRSTVYEHLPGLVNCGAVCMCEPAAHSQNDLEDTTSWEQVHTPLCTVYGTSTSQGTTQFYGMSLSEHQDASALWRNARGNTCALTSDSMCRESYRHRHIT